MSVSRSNPFPASLFSAVPGLSGLGQTWRVAARLWNAPPVVGEAVLLCTALLWCGLLMGYIAHAIRAPARTLGEFRHPVAGGAPALLGISAMLLCQAVLPYSRSAAWALTAAGISWHLMFSVWHTSERWRGEQQSADTLPTLYLPTVAGNFTGAAALGALGQTSWAWLFLGAGVFSWLALEPLVIRRLWHDGPLPAAQRPLLGIQFAPPVVCSSALLVIAPCTPEPGLMMLLGYGLFQVLIALRLRAWLGVTPFDHSWWAFSFGAVSAALTCLKLASGGVHAASILALPVFIGANLFICYLCLRSLTTVVVSIQARNGTAR
jgi:tellurite resistance protein